MSSRPLGRPATVSKCGTRVPGGKLLGEPRALLLPFMRFRRFLAMSSWPRRQVWIWALTACLPLFAQEFRAGITGIVKDSQGAVVPGVPIEAQNLATNDIDRKSTRLNSSH